jgi:hypothetical protein
MVEVYSASQNLNQDLHSNSHIDPVQNNSNALGAIVLLTRGYDNDQAYASLINRNEMIYQKINMHAKRHYPVIVFHEGNITEAQQTFITNAGNNTDVRFIDISNLFLLPKYVEEAKLQENWPLGYRLMCKFNSHDVWHLCRNFKYLLRVDEDCILESIVADPFEWAETEGVDFGYSFLCKEDHGLTNDSLTHFVEAFIRNKNPNITWSTADIYNHQFPYTNVMLARIGMFYSGDPSEFINLVVREPDFYYKRWGDLPIIGIIINIYFDACRVKPIKDLIYKHQSHSTFINTTSAASFKGAKSDNVDKTLLSRIDEIANLINNKVYTEAERLILKNVLNDPSNIDLKRMLIEVTSKLHRSELVSRLTKYLR